MNRYTLPEFSIIIINFSFQGLKQGRLHYAVKHVIYVTIIKNFGRMFKKDASSY